MTVQWGDTGRVTIGSLKTLTISPYVNEQNLTATALPVGAGASNVPGTPQVSFTVNTSTMVPTFSGVKVNSYKSVYGFNVSGQNTSGASQTVYYQINKNGTSYKTGNTSVVNNNYYTVSLEDGTFVNNDKIDFYIWTPASSGVNYLYQNSFCLPSRVDTGAKNICEFTINTVVLASSTYFPLASTASSQWAGACYIYTSDETNINYTGLQTNTGRTVSIPLFGVGSTFKLYYLQAEGTNNSIVSNTGYPRMQNSVIATSISYRDLFY